LLHANIIQIYSFKTRKHQNMVSETGVLPQPVSAYNYYSTPRIHQQPKA